MSVVFVKRPPFAATNWRKKRAPISTCVLSVSANPIDNEYRITLDFHIPHADEIFLMLSDVTVRHAQPDDVATIVSFNMAMARETEHKELCSETLRAGVLSVINHSHLGQYFLACQHETILGQLMITSEWSDWRKGLFWWIQSVYVSPDYRRKQVFRKLYEHLYESALHSENVIGIRLYVEQNNLLAQNAYHNLGMNNAGYFVFEKLL